MEWVSYGKPCHYSAPDGIIYIRCISESWSPVPSKMSVPIAGAPLRTSSAVSSAKMESHRRNASKADMVTVHKVYLRKRDTLL